MSPDEVHAVAERVDARLATTVWDLRQAEEGAADVSAAAEVALFALKLAGKRRAARLGGRFSRLVVRFALAACVAMATVASACSAPDANPEATAVAISQLATANPATAMISNPPRASPARFTDLILVDAGSDAQPWALMAAKNGDAPILVDRVGAGLQTVGGVYRMAAQPVIVGTRDGPSQFLDPLEAAVSTGSDPQTATANKGQLVQRWGQDERYLAVTRAIAGQPTVLDAAYNAPAASAAGGTHTYLNGIVLRVEPDKPVLQVVDRALLESGRPTRAEDVVYVAIRASESALYDAGQVVNLRDVVMDKQTTDVNGQATTVYVANAALDGARVEPTDHVDLQALLQPRLQVVSQDLAVQNQIATGASAASPAPVAAAQPTATPGGTTPVQQPIIIQQSRDNGSSYIGDFLIFMWLTNGGFYRGGGGTTIINNYPYGRPSGSVYYSPPPAPSGNSPSTIASSQAASRSTALEAARSSVSGQSSGTGGGVAATNKSAADATARVGAATSKSAAVAGAVSASSAGKSISSAPAGSSSTASRSAGSVSAGSRGSAGSSSGSSSGGKGIGGSSGGSSSSGSSGGFGGGGKGISGGSSGSSS